MNLNTANLMVGKAASVDMTRTNITGIHVTATHTEATNGHILARVSLPYQYEADDIPGSIPTESAESIKAFVIPAKPAMAVKLFKKNHFPCLTDTLYVDVIKTNLNGTAKFTATDRESTISPELSKIDAEYPDTDLVFPSGKADWKKTVNIEYLEKLLAIAKSTGKETISIYGYNDFRPVYLETINEGTDQAFRGLLMPVKDK
jgi:DNA polymerase III sliding clamp (beta) subunit (PCNA family)